LAEFADIQKLANGIPRFLQLRHPFVFYLNGF
jgi:hypothetical protein